MIEPLEDSLVCYCGHRYDQHNDATIGKTLAMPSSGGTVDVDVEVPTCPCSQCECEEFEEREADYDDRDE